MSDPNFIDGLHGTAYIMIGGLMAAVTWCWDKVKKCEERHDRIDGEKRLKKLTKPRKLQKTRK